MQFVQLKLEIESQQKNDQIILTPQDLDIEKLLKDNYLLDNIKKQQGKYAQIIIQNKKFLKQLLMCILRPQELIKENIKISPKDPYICLSLINMLHQFEYNNLLFKSIKNQLEISEEQELLDQYFIILQSDEVLDTTASGYLLKLLMLVLDTHTNQFFEYLNKKNKILKNLIKWMPNLSIMDFIIELLAVFSEENMLLNKFNLLIQIFQYLEKIKKQQNLDKIEQYLESIEYLFYNMIDSLKNNEVIENFIVLLNFMISEENIQIINQIIRHFQTCPQIIKNSFNVLIQCIKYLEFQQKVEEKKNSFGQFFGVKPITEKKIKYIEKELLVLLINICKFVQDKINPESLDLTKAYNCQFIQLVAHLLNFQQNQEIQLLFTPKLIKLCIQLLKKNPLKNILHFHIEKILHKSISSKVNQQLLNKDLNLIPFILSIFKQTQEKIIMFKFHLFYIAKQIQEQTKKNEKIKEFIQQTYPQWQNFIQMQYKAIDQIYTKKLGGDIIYGQTSINIQKKAMFEDQLQSMPQIVTNTKTPIPIIQIVKINPPIIPIIPTFAQIQNVSQIQSKPNLNNEIISTKQEVQIEQNIKNQKQPKKKSKVFQDEDIDLIEPPADYLSQHNSKENQFVKT